MSKNIMVMDSFLDNGFKIFYDDILDVDILKSSVEIKIKNEDCETLAFAKTVENLEEIAVFLYSKSSFTKE